MSILIKGITPPGSCNDCPFSIILDDLFGLDKFAFCIPLNEKICGPDSDTEVARELCDKLSKCPIVPLPPNLIDVDKFKSDYHMGDDCSTCKQNTKSCEYDRIYSKMDFCSWLDDAERIGEENE